MRRLGLGLVLGVSLCAAAPAIAQQGTSEIGGRVTDAQGGVLPGVAIVVTNEDTGTFREVITNEDGSYFVSQMIPGVYRVSARLEGFKGLERRGISVTVGVTTTLNLTLEVGGVAETITVTGDAPLVDVTSAEVGATSQPRSWPNCRREIAATWRLWETCREPSSFPPPAF